MAFSAAAAPAAAPREGLEARRRPGGGPREGPKEAPVALTAGMGKA